MPYKINILYEFKDGPYGGGNQFLKALKSEFVKLGVYENEAEKADIIILNGHQFMSKRTLKTVYLLKKSGKILIHRIDGPMSQHRSEGRDLDKLIYMFIDVAVEGTVFQSESSRGKNHKQGLRRNKNEIVITNAPDKTIFNKKEKSNFIKGNKIKLIATSWSSNTNKGFDTYKYLDETLDFSKFQMTFVGSSPIKFKNIRHITPVHTSKVAKLLKDNDIYITAAEKEACSNSLLEALHCGLPAVAINSGGNSETVTKGGEMFNKKEEILSKINKLINNYKSYQQNINLPSIDNLAKKYYNFCVMVKDNEPIKALKYRSFLWFRIILNALIIKNIIISKLTRLFNISI